VAAAGASATNEAHRQKALAEAHEREAALAHDKAVRFGLAGVTEKRVPSELAPLSSLGYHLLPDRAWPGNRSAQVDLIVVGPLGVHMVDTKAWKGVSIHEGRIFGSQADVTEDSASLADLVYQAKGILVTVGLAPTEVHAVAHQRT